MFKGDDASKPNTDRNLEEMLRYEKEWDRIFGSLKKAKKKAKGRASVAQ